VSATNEIVRRPGSEQDRELLYTLLERALGPQTERTYGPWDESWQRPPASTSAFACKCFA